MVGQPNNTFRVRLKEIFDLRRRMITGGFPGTISVAAAGAVDGDGSTGTPLSARVDGVTIIINASNELEVVGVPGSGASPAVLLDGTQYPMRFGCDGQGAVLLTGVQNASIEVPPQNYDGRLVGWNLYSPISGSIEIDVRKNGSSVTAGFNPELVAAAEADDVDLSDWSDVTVVAGNRFTIEILSVTTIEYAELTLYVERD